MGEVQNLRVILYFEGGMHFLQTLAIHSFKNILRFKYKPYFALCMSNSERGKQKPQIAMYLHECKEINREMSFNSINNHSN